MKRIVFSRDGWILTPVIDIYWGNYADGHRLRIVTLWSDNYIL